MFATSVKGIAARLTKYPYLVLLVLVSALGIAVSAATVLGPGPFLDFWDDFYYVYFSHYIAVQGFQNIVRANFVTEYLLSGIPAIFFRLFGVSLLSEGLFSMFCLVGVIACIFLIAKLLHNELSGIISALSFIFIPLVAAEGAASGDNMAVAFFSTLAVLLLLLGVKEKKRSYYALSGFVGVIGALAGSALNVTIFLFLIPCLLYLLFRDRGREQRLRTVFFFSGILLAVLAAMALGYVLQSDPLIFFATNFGPGSYPVSQSPAFARAVSVLFPQQPAYGSNAQFFWPYELGSGVIYPNVIGFFGYAMAASAIYLLIRKKYKVLVPLAWFGVLFLYLAFGKDSLSLGGYIIFVPRFLIILMPPLSITIGLGLSVLAESLLLNVRRRRASWRSAVSGILMPALTIAYVLLIANSVLLMRFLNYANYVLTYQTSQTASELASLPKNVSIYITTGMSGVPGPSGFPTPNPYGIDNVTEYIRDTSFLYWFSVEDYAGYAIPINYSVIFTNCSAIKGDYVIGVNTTVYENGLPLCSNLEPVFSPQLQQASQTAYSPYYTYYRYVKDNVLFRLYKKVS